MTLPRYSRPRRFFEIRQHIKFTSDLAKERFIEQIRASGPEGVFLGAPMLGLNKDATITFPTQSELPILTRDIEALEMTDFDQLETDKVSLSIATEDTWWVMDTVEGEPIKLSDIDSSVTKDLNIS